VDSYYNKY